MENTKPGDGNESKLQLQSQLKTQVGDQASSSDDGKSAAGASTDNIVPVTLAPRKFKRKLTTFLAQEMLYDFAMGTLDHERRLAVEEFVAGDRECQSILESIRGSLVFAEKLSATELKPEALAHLKESENMITLSRRYSKWHTWPDSMRWSIVAVSVSIIFAGAVAMVPWQRISHTAGNKGPESVEVAKIPTESTEQLKTVADNSELDSAIDEGSGDEADLADVGSGDNDEAGSGDAAALTTLSPSQMAKQAQDDRKQAKAEAAAHNAEDEAARKTEARERKLATKSGLNSNSDEIETPSIGVSVAPFSISRKQMPLIASLMDRLLVTPLGVLPQTGSARPGISAGVSDESDIQTVAAADVSENGVRESAADHLVDKKGLHADAAGAGANTKLSGEAAAVLSQSGQPSGAESYADSSGDASIPNRTANAPLGGAAANGTTALTISQIPETAAKGGIKPRGFVYRAFMNLDDLDTLGPKITQLIQELGGVKAGEVELGWKKGNAVRYYHFSMPEDSQDKLLEQLQTYGPVRISKDPHPRIMPNGQIRFILWVESSKSVH